MRITWTSLMLSWSPSNCTSTGNLVDNLAQRKLQWYVAVLWLRQWVSLVCFPYGPWWVHTSGVGVSIGGWADAAACQRCVHCEEDSRTFFTSLLWGLDPSWRSGTCSSESLVSSLLFITSAGYLLAGSLWSHFFGGLGWCLAVGSWVSWGWGLGLLRNTIECQPGSVCCRLVPCCCFHGSDDFVVWDLFSGNCKGLSES